MKGCNPISFRGHLLDSYCILYCPPHACHMLRSGGVYERKRKRKRRGGRKGRGVRRRKGWRRREGRRRREWEN